MRTIKIVICVCLLAGGAPAQEIERVEPPFWWAGFEHRELQLLVFGNNVSLLTPTIDSTDIAVNRIVRVESPNFLFLYLDIPPRAARYIRITSYGSRNPTYPTTFFEVEVLGAMR